MLTRLAVLPRPGSHKAENKAVRVVRPSGRRRRIRVVRAGRRLSARLCRDQDLTRIRYVRMEPQSAERQGRNMYAPQVQSPIDTLSLDVLVVGCGGRVLDANSPSLSSVMCAR